MPNLRQVVGDPLSDRNVTLVVKELKETAVAVSVVGTARRRLHELADLAEVIADALTGVRPEVVKPRTRLRQRIHDVRISNVASSSAARNIRSMAEALVEIQELLGAGIGNAVARLKVMDFDLLNVWGYTEDELGQAITMLKRSARELASVEMELGPIVVELGRGTGFAEYLSDRDALGIDPGKSGAVADVMEAIASRLWSVEFRAQDREVWGGKTSRLVFSRAFAKAMTGHSVDAETAARLQVTVGKMAKKWAVAA